MESGTESTEDRGLIEKGKEATEEALGEVLGWALDKSLMEHGPIECGLFGENQDLKLGNYKGIFG